MRTEILTINGVKYIAVDGKIIDTLAFKSFRPTKNNVSDFYNAGVRIFHVYCSGLKSALKVPYSAYGETWFGNGDYCFDSLDRQIEMFIKNAPDAYLFINVHLDVRQWWLDQNPGRPNSFTHLSQIAADDKWRTDTAEYLKVLICHVEEKYEDKVLGYFLLGGHTTEWFSDKDYEESHPIKLAAFRKYMGDDSITIPTKEELEKPETQIFLDPKKDAKVIAYRKFHAELISDLILYFCREAQTVLEHKKLLGLFFGYILELLGPRIWNAGHLDIDRVYRSSDIDYIATPSSYQFRGYNDASACMILCDTLELNGKMYFDSFDHTTYLVPGLPEHPRRLSNEPNIKEALTLLANMRRKGNDLLEDQEKTIHAIYREFMNRLAGRTGMWWFDMLEGWFYDDALMSCIKQLTGISGKLLEKPRASNAQIAVFVSCESLYYVNKCSRINTETICNQRDALARMGAPYDMYSLNDLDRVDRCKYKLFIFLDAYYLTAQQRKYINSRLKGGGRSLLFIGACDYINDTGINVQRIAEITEMDVRLLDTDEAIIHAFDTSYGYENAKTPTVYVHGDYSKALGHYVQSACCGLACKETGDYAIYFSGLGNLSHSALREIARQAGVHIYAENGIATYINSGVVGVYNTRDNLSTVTLPEDGEFTELFSGKYYKTENKMITLPTGKCPAQMLMLNE